MVRLVPRDPYSADLYLAQQLDHETRQEHSLLLTLTDSKLGQDNFITQVGTRELTGCIMRHFCSSAAVVAVGGGRERQQSGVHLTARPGGGGRARGAPARRHRHRQVQGRGQGQRGFRTGLCFLLSVFSLLQLYSP